MIINVIFIIVIIAGITGIFFCLKADKKNPKKRNPESKILALVLLLIIIACTIAILVRSVNPDDNEEQAVSEELFHSRVSGLTLGRYLARTAPGFNALIITHDENSENELLDAALSGLREGLGGKVKIAAVDSPLPAPSGEKSSGNQKTKISPERMLYLSRNMQSDNFDRLIAKHLDCNLIISLIGLPKDANKMRILSIKPEKRPKLAILSGNLSLMKDRISQGDISVAVITRPGYIPGKKKLPKDIESVFDRRYLLVTPDNINLIASEHPEIFKK